MALFLVKMNSCSHISLPLIST